MKQRLRYKLQPVCPVSSNEKEMGSTGEAGGGQHQLIFNTGG